MKYTYLVGTRTINHKVTCFHIGQPLIYHDCSKKARFVVGIAQLYFQDNGITHSAKN